MPPREIFPGEIVPVQNFPPFLYTCNYQTACLLCVYGTHTPPCLQSRPEQATWRTAGARQRTGRSLHGAVLAHSR